MRRILGILQKIVDNPGQGLITLPPSFACLAAAARPLRIAVVTSRPPLPMARADQMTVAHWLAFLAARGHRVELFALHDAPVEPAAQA